MSSYYFSPIFVTANSSWLVFESTKALEITTSLIFNLDFASTTTLPCFFSFFLIIDLYFLIPAAIAQIFNSITKLVIPIGISSKEAKEEIEIHPVITEARIRKCSIQFRVV